MRSLSVSCVLLAACGRIGFDGADAGGDTALADVAIDPTAPFTNVQPIGSLNGATADDDPSLTGDLLEIMFDSDRPITNGSDLIVSHRAAVGDTWSGPTLIAELASPNDEDTPCLSADGLELTLASDRTGTAGMNDLWRSTRASRTATWSTPVRIPELCGAAADEHLSRTADELLGVFTSDRPGGQGGYDIYVTTRIARTDPWSAPVNVTELNSAEYDQDPSLDGSGTIIYFSSVRTGGRDIYVATRSDRSAPWSTPVVVPGLATPAEESDPWVSPDGRTIVFTRGSGVNRELYTATR